MSKFFYKDAEFVSDNDLDEKLELYYQEEKWWFTKGSSNFGNLEIREDSNFLTTYVYLRCFCFGEPLKENAEPKRKRSQG